MTGIKIFSDGADTQTIARLNGDPNVAGFTTNPSLIRKSGVTDFRSYCTDLLRIVQRKPISFPVLSDDLSDMECEAAEIGGWSTNVFVKIPITNTRGESSIPLVTRLLARGVKTNVTAIMSISQISELARAIKSDTQCFVSIIAGRIADTGIDPVPLVRLAVEKFQLLRSVELIWASCREPINVLNATAAGCHIVTVPESIRRKLVECSGVDLDEYSLETIREQHRDILASGLSLPPMAPQMAAIAKS